MARPEKVAVVEEIKEKFEAARAVFVTEYRGLTVGQQQELRRSLRKADADYKVLKMTLARRAATEAGYDELLEWLEGPTAIAFAGGDPVPTAKSLKDFAALHDSLVVKGGMLAGATLDADAIRRLADIEPRPVLLAKLAGAMSAPMSKLAGLMNAIMRQPVTAMQQLLEKKQQEAPAEPEAAEPGAAEPEAAEEAAEPEAEEAAEPEAAEPVAGDVENEAADEPGDEEPADSEDE